MDRVRMLSQARQELFAIFEEVTAHAGRKVILRHRGSERDAVLVSREYLERLEQERAGTRAPPFSLFGSAKLSGPLDDVLTELRHDAQTGFEGKLAAISGEPARPPALKTASRRASSIKVGAAARGAKR